MEHGRNHSRGGVFYIFLACFFWGTGGTVFTLYAPDDAQVAVIAIMKLFVTAVVLAGLILLRRSNDERRPWKLPNLLTAGFLTACTQFCFFSAIDLAGVALGTTFFIGSYPVFAGLLAFLIRKENPGRKWVASTGLAIVGGVMMILGNVVVDGDPLGVLAALGAAFSFALFAVISKDLLAVHSGISVIGMTSAIGVVCLSPLLFVYDLAWVVQDAGVVVPLALYLGVVTSIFPLLLFAKGITLVQVATAATLNLVEPMTATLLGVVILQEQLALQSWLGMLLLVIGVLWLSLPTSLLRKLVPA